MDIEEAFAASILIIIDWSMVTWKSCVFSAGKTLVDLVSNEPLRQALGHKENVGIAF
jgi:hypothetical protein